jgi:hypothetical protein
VVFGDGAGSKRDSETIVNLDRGLVTEIDAPNLTVLSQRNGEYCACVTVAGGGTLRAGGDIALSAAAATEETSEPPQTPEAGLWIARNGDIYIDLSMVELESIWIKALGSIVVSDLDSTPVPEPGPALLVGLGLIALASRRR